MMSRLQLFPFGIAVIIYNLVGSLLAWAAGWPPQFGGNPNPDQSYLSYLVGGSAIHAPLPPLFGLVIGLLLSRRRDRWRFLGFGMVGVVAILFVIGVLGELFAEHAFVPVVVVISFGIVNALIGLVLLYLVIRQVRDHSIRP